MNKNLSEEIFFQLWVTDFDYVATRHLMAGAFFPTAGSLANLVMDRYIKTFFLSIERDDLVKKIKDRRGNESHNVPIMVEEYNTNFSDKLVLTLEEIAILENIFKSYCFRYPDYMFKTKSATEIRDYYMHTIDKVVYFFREKITLNPIHSGKTLIDLLLREEKDYVSTLSQGNVNLREVFLMSNKQYFK